MPPIPEQLFRLAHGTHARLAALGRSARRVLGIEPPLSIVPYRGFGTTRRALIKARVVEDRGTVTPDLERGLLDGAVTSVRRFATAEIPHERVAVRWGERVYEGRTDAEGFLDLWVDPPVDARPGACTVRLTLPDHPSAAQHALVFVVGDEARYGVITDVDDTIIVTGVRNLAKRAWALFMPEATRRLPFPGVPELYRGFVEGRSDGERNPVFYVSSSPWNLYEHLCHFLSEHGLPAGPLLLRDWGLTESGFAPDGRHEHKLDKILSVVDAFDDLPFVLVGDSGQHDAEHYATIARARPGRVACIYIRRVPDEPGRASDLEALAARARDAGCDLVAFDASVDLARDAARRGLVDAGLADRVGR